MTGRAYYNEHDPKAAEWLRELIKAGLIAPGDVDTRDIQEIKPHELSGYTQQHFFAGIGGWSLALRLAGWPDDRPVRTGSCPCQPFSAAGKGLGEADARHLWPVFRDLITFGEPTATFGEQVASAAGRLWLSRVRADLEGLGYGVGAADLCSAGVGAPNIRQRLYWVANPYGKRRAQRAERHGESQRPEQPSPRWADAYGCSGPGGLADTGHEQPGGTAATGQAKGGRAFRDAPGCGFAGRLGDASGEGPQERVGNGRVQREALEPQQGQAAECGGNARRLEHATRDRREQRRAESGGRCAVGGRSLGFWSAYELLACTDGKARRIEPCSFPLAHGVSGRVGLLRGYGNAINPELAAEFIRACRDIIE